MPIQILLDNVGRKFKTLTCRYKPTASISGIHDTADGRENVTKVRTLVNGIVKLSKEGNVWTPGHCPAKNGPASFSSREDGIRQVISVEWAD